MSALADALEAYEMAIACGADSLTKAERLQDVINTGKADITQTYEKEQSMSGQGIVICYTKCWPCQFGECRDSWHTWADADDIEHAKQTGQPEPSNQRCGCYCQRGAA